MLQQKETLDNLINLPTGRICPVILALRRRWSFPNCGALVLQHDTHQSSSIRTSRTYLAALEHTSYNAYQRISVTTSWNFISTFQTLYDDWGLERWTASLSLTSALLSNIWLICQTELFPHAGRFPGHGPGTDCFSLVISSMATARPRPAPHHQDRRQRQFGPGRQTLIIKNFACMKSPARAG